LIGDKKAFGQFSSNKTQRPFTVKPYVIELDAQEDAVVASYEVDFNKGNILIKQNGVYLLIACPQISKVRGTTPRWIDFWVRVNNINIPNSNIRTVLVDPEEKMVVPLNLVWPLRTGDTINIIMAVETNDEGIGIEAIIPDSEPTIPSIIVTVVQLD